MTDETNEQPWQDRILDMSLSEMKMRVEELEAVPEPTAEQEEELEELQDRIESIESEGEEDEDEDETGQNEGEATEK
jgi:division protein CdvB (Snf7/Vps24/ESCRT-III family)